MRKSRGSDPPQSRDLQHRQTARKRAWLAPLLIALVLIAGCRTVTPQLLETQRYANADRVIETVANVPVQLTPTLSRTPSPIVKAGADQLSVDFDAALAAAQISVIPSDRVAEALELDAEVLGAAEPSTLARGASVMLRADAILVTRLSNYRDRSGSGAGSMFPASVTFTTRLYSAPEGRLLWSALFDLTQSSLLLDPARSAQLPGGGTRWLSAAELARFGAGRVAPELAKYLRATRSQ